MRRCSNVLGPHKNLYASRRVIHFGTIRGHLITSPHAARHPLYVAEWPVQVLDLTQNKAHRQLSPTSLLYMPAYPSQFVDPPDSG
jgi:hypothetical protein